MFISRDPSSTWSSEKLFILVTIAAAVGLGNIWRFPYIAGENGGAAFILAYLISVLFLGIPLMILELAAGRAERGSPVHTFRNIWRKAAPFGWLIAILTLIITSYYLVITGWTLGFAVDSYTGDIKSFSDFTDGYASVIYFFIVAAIVGAVVAIGTNAIEYLSKLLMPVLFLSVIVLIIYSLSLPGREEAFSFIFSPDFSALYNPTIWLLAFGQAFYSLAVGQGYLITYGSLAKRDVNLPRSSAIIASVETSVALLSGIMIFPLVFTFGLDPGEGTELAFTALPFAFENMPFGGVLAIIFFTLFCLAAISSSVAGFQVVKTVVKQELNLSNIKATLLSFVPMLPLGLLSAISFTPISFEVLGRPFLEVLDLFAANQIVVICGVVGGAIIAWKIPKSEIVEGFGFRWRRLVWF